MEAIKPKRIAGGRLVLAAAIVVAASSLIWFVGTHEPTAKHEGKPLLYWLSIGRGEKALEELGTNAVPELLSMIQADLNPNVRTGLVSLNSFVRQRLKQTNFWALQRHLGRQALGVSGFQILGARASNAVPELARLIERPGSIGWSAADSLGGIGEPAIPTLLSAASNEDPIVRANGFRGLVSLRLGWQADFAFALDHALASLQDTNEQGGWTLRHSAVYLLGRMPSESAIVSPLLSDLMNDTDPRVRMHAVYGLAQHATNSAEQAAIFRRLVNDPDKEVAEAAGMSMKGAEINAELEAQDGILRVP